MASNSAAAGFNLIKTVSLNPTVSLNSPVIDVSFTNRYIKFTNFKYNGTPVVIPVYFKDVKIYGGPFTTYGNMYVNGSMLTTGKIGIGCSNPAYPLCVNGKIQATEVEVKTAPCSDYVFEPEYELKSLQEVEQYVIENKHLPEVPSAAEYGANGYNLGEFDNLMLRKVEELTLYIIEQNKKIEALQTELNAIKQEDALVE